MDQGSIEPGPQRLSEQDDSALRNSIRIDGGVDAAEVGANLGGHRVRAHTVHRQEQSQRAAKVLLVIVGIQDEIAEPVQPPGRGGDLNVCSGVRDRLKQSR